MPFGTRLLIMLRAVETRKQYQRQVSYTKLVPGTKCIYGLRAYKYVKPSASHREGKMQ